jgi:hypothetical protein
MTTLVFYITILPQATFNNDGYHIILIDFGKATILSQAKFYRLSAHKKQEYTIKYPHLAPEVIDGVRKQSIYSDNRPLPPVAE